MSLVEQLVSLLSAIVWPVTVLIVLHYLKNPIGDILGSLASRIKDPGSNVAISKDGLEIKSRLESLEIDQEQTKSLTLKALDIPKPTKKVETSASQKIPDELRVAADKYLKIEAPNWSQRVRLKDAAARYLSELVITKGVSREVLARQHHEGLILALATASHTLPLEGDVDCLLHVADETNRLHVKYRIVMAFGRLVEKGLIDKDQAESVKQVLKNYRHDADKSLLNRIQYTWNAINAFEHEKRK